MGLESYFVHILPTDVEPVHFTSEDGSPRFEYRGCSRTLALDVVARIKSAAASKGLSVRPGWRASDLVVDEAIEVWIGEIDGLFQKATLVGCFAWYDEGLRLGYVAFEAIRGMIEVRLYHQWAGLFTASDGEEFSQAVRNIYQHKHEEFLRMFGHIRGRVLPNKPFYDYYRRSRTPWGRLVMALKGVWPR